MKAKRYTEEQIIRILKEGESGAKASYCQGHLRYCHIIILHNSPNIFDLGLKAMIKCA